jgi:hypothetical protein
VTYLLSLLALTIRKPWSLAIVASIAAIAMLPAPSSAQVGRGGRRGNGATTTIVPRGTVTPRPSWVMIGGQRVVPTTTLINPHPYPSRGFVVEPGRQGGNGGSAAFRPFVRVSGNRPASAHVDYNNYTNPPVSSTQSSSTYWDPSRGWVTDTRRDTQLQGTLSPGRAPAPGATIYNYQYWDGSRWVQGQYWVGTDGQWHGWGSSTQSGPYGSHTESVTTSANPQ